MAGGRQAPGYPAPSNVVGAINRSQPARSDKHGSPTLIVVTGVTRGLGRAMLDEFVARGHIVAGCGRAEAAIETLRRTFPEPNRFATVDVADDMQVGQWARHVLTTLGPPQLLINNAGVMNAPAPLWEAPAAEFAPGLALQCYCGYS